jgi:hypothetical protein
MRLWEITKDLETAVAFLESEEFNEDECVKLFDAIEDEWDDKADSVATVFKEYTAEAAALKAESDALKKRADKAEKNAEWLKKYLSDEMLKAGKAKLETKHNLVTFRKSTAVEIDENKFFLADTPNKYIISKTTLSADKKALMVAIKEDGEVIPGAVVVERQNIQIK